MTFVLLLKHAGWKFYHTNPLAIVSKFEFRNFQIRGLEEYFSLPCFILLFDDGARTKHLFSMVIYTR